MKKLSLICMAALFLLAASCKKEKENEDTGFVATTESHAGDSKTHLSEEAVHWDVGDKIRVHSQVSTTDLAQGWWDFKATNIEGKKADFTGVNENDFECVPQGFYKPDYTAVYPAEMVSAIGDKTCTISLPQAQTYVPGGFYRGANPMMANSSTTTLSFKNICGLVELMFYGERACNVDYITLTSDDVNEMLWGSATVTFGDEPSSSLSGGDNTITLNCNDMDLSTIPAAPSVFHFVVPANRLASGFTVQIHLTGSENVCVKHAPAGAAVVRSKILTMPVLSVAVKDPVVPSQVTLVSGLDNITNTVTCGVTFPQGSSITECGLVYSTTDETPTIAGGATKIIGQLSKEDTDKTFTVSSASLTGTSLYYVRAYAKIDGVTYSETKTYSTVPLPCSWDKGKNPYPFTVASGKEVYFSSGNLQYCPKNANASAIYNGNDIGGNWQFAQHQFDLIHTLNDDDVSDEYKQGYNDWIDLFGWATSGFNHATTNMMTVNYQPWCKNGSNSTSYKAYGNQANDLDAGTGTNKGKADWGKHFDGGWRTLTDSEWQTLMNRTKNNKYLYGFGKVVNTKGLIILPDDWDLDVSPKITTGTSDWTNSYSYSEWDEMESKGAVFLPAAGSRNEISVTVSNDEGYYWSSTHYGSETYYAYGLYFKSNTLTTHNQCGRHLGCSVRLVSDTPPTTTK